MELSVNEGKLMISSFVQNYKCLPVIIICADQERLVDTTR